MSAPWNMKSKRVKRKTVEFAKVAGAVLLFCGIVGGGTYAIVMGILWLSQYTVDTTPTLPVYTDQETSDQYTREGLIRQCIDGDMIYRFRGADSIAVGVGHPACAQ